MFFLIDGSEGTFVLSGTDMCLVHSDVDMGGTGHFMPVKESKVELLLGR